MAASFGNSVVTATEIGGQFRPSKDRYVRKHVGPVCRAIWPEKTDVEVAIVCGCDPRNARRYMSGELPIPARLMAAINAKLVEEEGLGNATGNCDRSRGSKTD